MSQANSNAADSSTTFGPSQVISTYEFNQQQVKTENIAPFVALPPLPQASLGAVTPQAAHLGG